MDLSDFEEELKDAFLSELKGSILDEMGELMLTGGAGEGGHSEGEGEDGGVVGGTPRHKGPNSIEKH